MKIAYLRPQGTFGWYVAQRDTPDGELLPQGTHGRIIQAVAQGEAERGIVARENSIGGSVPDTVDPLIAGLVGIAIHRGGNEIVPRPGDAMICGEVVLPVVQCLYGRRDPGGEITKVYSHPQGLAQCEKFIAREFPQAQLVSTDSTIGGVEKLLDDAAAVAIAPPWAGDFYPDVVLLKKGIQDRDGNTTRFLVVGKEDCQPTGTDKTSICFTVPGDEKPGSLVKVLQVFASGDLNMRLIESRPAKTVLGKYVFLVDLDCHRTDSIFSSAIELIVRAGLATSFRILGSYPRWENGNS